MLSGVSFSRFPHPSVGGFSKATATDTISVEVTAPTDVSTENVHYTRVDGILVLYNVYNANGITQWSPMRVLVERNQSMFQRHVLWLHEPIFLIETLRPVVLI